MSRSHESTRIWQSLADLTSGLSAIKSWVAAGLHETHGHMLALHRLLICPRDMETLLILATPESEQLGPLAL